MTNNDYVNSVGIVQASQTFLAQRQAFLQGTDWTQLPDVDLTAEQRQAWVDYRKALRDINSKAVNPEFPYNVVWPTPPQE